MQLYEFHKREVPEDEEEEVEFIEKLMNFKVSLQQYKAALEMDNMSPPP